MATIKDVARIAGVSSAMVSRYLNDGYVSAEKRPIIAAAIEECGYRPSQQARSLRRGRSRLVGVVVPRINSESVARITAGIEQGLSGRGYQMLLANTDNQPEQELAYLDLFAGYPVDGLILVGSVVSDAHSAFLASCPVPAVVVGQRFDGVSCVLHDDYGAARDLASRLAASAPDATFAYLSVDPADVAVGVRRREGFEAGLAERGAVLDPALVRRCDFSAESGLAVTRRLLDDRDRLGAKIDFICCSTDLIAAGALRAVAERRWKDGMTRPTVTGFGDNRIVSMLTGGIPTVHFAYRTSGVKSAEMLVDLVEDPKSMASSTIMGYRIEGI
ncbi:LacI family DNA-binding transcriptional regulator [Atopobiaceae bacterium 24-176]